MRGFLRLGPNQAKDAEYGKQSERQSGHMSCSHYGGFLGRVANRHEAGFTGNGTLHHCLVSLLDRFSWIVFILYSRKQLPPMRVFKHRRWLVLLIIATCGLLGNFVLFSSSLQYLSPTASQVIGQLSPVGMMFASVLILKEKMRITQVIGACMLISGLLLFLTSV